MKALVIGSFAAFLALQMGCQKADPTPAPAPVVVVAATPPAATVEAAGTEAAADVPTQEDYEANAAKTIVSSPIPGPGPLTQELDKLEKEIGQ